jgi:hypothetical protein
MWIPVRIEKFIEAVTLRLQAIQEAIEQQTAADDAANEASRKQWRQVRRMLSVVIKSKNQTNADTSKQQEQKRNDPESRLIGSQEEVAKWTKRAAIAAILYGAVAFWQGCMMRQTYTEIKNQTKAAEESAYASCRSAQLSREVTLQNYALEATNQVGANASTIQAWSAIEAEKAYVVVVQNETLEPIFTSKGFGAPWVLAVQGHTAARNLSLVVNVELVTREGDLTHHLNRKTNSSLSTPYAQANSQFTKLGLAHAQDDDGTDLIPPPHASEDFRAGIDDLLLFGSVSFYDIYGVHHWSKFCSVRHTYQEGESFTSGHPKCRAYNHEDNNQLLKPKSPEVIPPPEIPEIPCTAPPK